MNFFLSFFFFHFFFISLMFESMNSSGSSAVSRPVSVIHRSACCLWSGGVFAQVEAGQCVVKKKERLLLFLHFSAHSCRSDVLLDHISGCGKLSGCSCSSPFVSPFTGGITQRFTERIKAVQANQPRLLATSALKDVILPPQCF